MCRHPERHTECTYHSQKVTWAHPAFANGRLYTRNDKELICVQLVKD